MSPMVDPGAPRGPPAEPPLYTPPSTAAFTTPPRAPGPQGGVGWAQRRRCCAGFLPALIRRGGPEASVGGGGAGTGVGVGRALGFSHDGGPQASGHASGGARASAESRGRITGRLSLFGALRLRGEEILILSAKSGFAGGRLRDGCSKINPTFCPKRQGQPKGLDGRPDSVPSVLGGRPQPYAR